MSTINYHTAPRHLPFWPILTQQARVPWAWVFLIQLPWFTGNIVESISSTMMTFTLKKFTDSVIVITMLTNFNIVFNMLVGATCNYMSDRTWTRFGRRRPFLIVASLVTFTFLMIIPLAREFWLLVGLLFMYEMLRDIGAPTEPLEKEVVPPPQRGRGQAITQVVRTAGALTFAYFLIGRFDDTYQFGMWTLPGELVVYWIGAAFALVTALFYMFGVRELPPPPIPASPVDAPPTNPPPPEQGTLVVVAFFKRVFGNRHNWAIYIIGVAMMFFWTGLGALTPLLTTEQFGYSKQTMGNIASVGQIATLITVVLLGGWIVDRADRSKLFQLCAVLMTLHHIAFYGYARFIAPGGIPPVWALMAFGVFSGIVGNVGVMAAVALQFDFMSTSQMGTISAGIGITRTVFDLLTRNIIGIWVAVYSARYVADGKTDYLAGYHYLILFGILATCAAVWFSRYAKSGRLVAYGVMEQQERLSQSAS